MNEEMKDPDSAPGGDGAPDSPAPLGRTPRKRKYQTVAERGRIKPKGVKALQCRRIKNNGDRCKAFAILGGTVCYMHGGAAPQTVAAADRHLKEQATEQAVESAGLGQGLIEGADPAEIMLEAVRKSAYNVRVYERAIANMRTEVGDHGDRDTVVLELWGQGGSTTVSANALVKLYDEERDRMVKYAVDCRKVGVEERRVAISAEQGQQLAGALRLAVAGAFEIVRALIAAGQPLSLESLNAIEVRESPAVLVKAVEAVRTRPPVLLPGDAK